MNYEHEQADNHIRQHNLKGVKAEEYRDTRARHPRRCIISNSRLSGYKQNG